MEPYVGPKEAAEFLKISKATILSLARQGRLPAYPIGDAQRRRWRFLKTELDSWLKGRVTSAASDPCRRV